MMSLLSNEQREVISEYGFNLIPNSSCMLESHQANNKVQLKHSEVCCLKDTPVENSLQMLVLDSISKDVALSPYWNARCQELQSNLFLPHRIESLVQDFHSLRDSLNYTVVKSSFWRKIFIPKDSMFRRLLVSLQASAIPKVENEHVDATKKIRVYPNEAWKVDKQIDVCRRAYNLCVAVYRDWKRGDSPINFTQLRSDVREIVRQEAIKNKWTICITSLDEACQEAKRANQAVIRKRVAGQKAELKFRKKIATKQGFIYQKLSKMGLPKVLGDLFITEEIPSESIGKLARIIRKYGRYFLVTKKIIPIAAAKIQGNAIGIDPGVRTFATTYSPNQVDKLGENFQSTKLKPLGIKLDRLYSKRKKLFNRWSKLPSQLREDLLRGFEKKINRLKACREDLIEDLHRRICYWLVTTYDFIFLPNFKVKQMTRKQKRKIGSKVVRSMMDLCHHRFKQMLAWMCRKYGKTLMIVNEAYTTQTQSWDGKRQNLKATNVISDGSISVDRDINGARGIFLRAITR